MIAQYIYLDNFDWSVKVFYEASFKDIDIVLDDLEAAECPQELLYATSEMFEDDLPNTGLTYTNNYLRLTVVVLMETTCAAEFQNTLDHEKGHAAVHIATHLGIDLEGEEYQYLQGELGREMFDAAKQFLCDSCRVN